MGLNVIGLDISDPNLEVTTAQGADHVFNTMTDKTYVDKIKTITNGGVHAATVFSNADAAYAGAPAIIRLGGTLMVIGIPKNPLIISAMDLVLGKYRVKADSTSIPQRMKKAIDFTAKHKIQPKMQVRKLEEVNDMVNEMHAGKAKTRMGVVF
jgi:propanol-preferring alcohol dehydrogenase